MAKNIIKDLTELQKLSIDVYTGNIKNYGKYSVAEGEDAIRKAINEACGGEWNYYSFMDNRWKVYAVMAETLSISTGNLLTDEFNEFVESRDTALGDTPEFTIESTELFRVSNIASGTNDLRRQKLYNGKLELTTFDLGVKIYEDFSKFLAGRINWQSLVNKVGLSYRVHIGGLIYKGMYESYNDLKAPFSQSGTYDNAKLLELIANVQASTGQTPYIYGTKKALGFIKDADSIMSENRKNELTSFGHYKDFQGTPMIELPQAYIPGTKKFMVNDDFLMIVPNGEKIVKLIFEGDPFIEENLEGGKRNDRQIEYLFTRKMGLGILKSDIYGIYRIG